MLRGDYFFPVKYHGLMLDQAAEKQWGCRQGSLTWRGQKISNLKGTLFMHEPMSIFEK